MKKVIIGLIAAVAIFSAYAVFAQGESTSAEKTDAAQQKPMQAFNETTCFQYDDFVDLWILNFEQVGNVTFQVTGHNPKYAAWGGGAIDGGGAIFENKFILTMDERVYSIFGSGGFAEHNIQINITEHPFKGKDHLVWFNINGTRTANFPAGLNFTEVTCPLPGVALEEGPTTAGQ